MDILDLVVSSDEELIRDVSVFEPLLADHMSISFELNYCVATSECTQVTRIFSKTGNLYAFLGNVNWDFLIELSQTSVVFWEELLLVCQYGIDTFIPIKKRSDFSKKSLFMLNQDTLTAIARKKVCYDSWKSSTTNREFWKGNLKYWTKKCNSLVSRDRSNHEQSVASNPDANAFHSYVRKVFNRPCCIPELRVGNVVFTEDIDKARCFNEFFCSVFTEDNNILPNFDVPAAAGISIETVDLSVFAVRNALSACSSSYSSGPDGVPSIVLKKCCDVLVEPLSSLFSMCFEEEILPQDWLCADVVPIYKGTGPISSPNNYRPVSLTVSSCKVMETCVKDQVLQYLLSNNLLSDHQQGFLPKRSTLKELLQCVNECITSVNKIDNTPRYARH